MFRQLSRFFSETSLKVSSKVKDLLTQIETQPYSLQLYQKLKEEVPEFSDYIKKLKDLEVPALYKVGEMKNEQLMMLLQHYSVSSQGSSRLYNTVSQHLFKRIHSFNFTDLSRICYFYCSVSGHERLFDVIENIVMKDPVQLDAVSCCRLAMAYGIKGKGSDNLWSMLGGVFIACRDKINTHEGIMFLTGITKKMYKDPALTSHIESWMKEHMQEFSGSLLTQALFCHIKAKLSDEIIQELEQMLNYDEMSAVDCEKLLGVYLVNQRKGPINKLLSTAQDILDESEVTPSEVINFIFTLKGYPNTSSHFTSIENYIQSKQEVLDSEEATALFSALLSTHKLSESCLASFQAIFSTQAFSPSQQLRILTTLLRCSNLHLPYTSPILSQVYSSIVGKSLSTEEYIVAVYSLSRLEYADSTFWDSVLKEARNLKIRDAESYMQLYMSIRHLSSLGVSTEGILDYLSSVYERKSK